MNSNLYIKIADGVEAEIPLKDIRLLRTNLAPDGGEVENITASAKASDWLACACALSIAMDQMDKRGVSLRSFLEGGSREGRKC